MTITYVYDPLGHLAAAYGGATPAVTGTLYLATDHLGLTRLVTSAGAVVGCHDYLPFGEEIPAGSYGRSAGSCSGVTETVLKYTGQERDRETGLDHFPARYGSPPQGRFLTPDPVGNFVANVANPQSWNLYSYVWNSPLANIDPTGACTVVDGAYQEDGGAPCPSAPYQSTTVTDTAPPPVPYEDCPFCDLVFGGGFGSTDQNGSGLPLPGSPTVNRFACASEFGKNHSISAAFGAQNTFVGGLFGGNTVSSLVNLGLAVSGNGSLSNADVGKILLKGGAQGVPVPPGNPGLSGAAGQLRSLGVQNAVAAGYNAIAGVGAQPIELGITASGTIATEVGRLSASALTNISTGVGLAKFAFDFTTFAIGYAKCGQ